MIDFNITNTSPTARLNAKVELYEGSTLVETCTCNDRLQEIVVERIGLNNKFFGFGIIHKLTVNLIDLERDLTVTKNNSLKVYFGYDTFISPYPTFYVAEVTRDESTNTITVVAYDKLYSANEHTVAEIATPYTLRTFAAAAKDLIGVNDVICGKNRWNNKNYTTSLTSDQITQTETGFIFTRGNIAGGREVSYTINVKAGETYTFSYDKEGIGQLFLYQNAVYGTVLKSTDDVVLTYTFEEDTKAVFTIIINSAVSSLIASNIQIEKSAIRTPYEPYLAAFDTNYPTGGNFEGTENYREALNAAAEATQTIYFLNNNEQLVFKRLDRGGSPVLTISKNDYYELDSGETRVLAAITNTNELGDSTSVEVDGITGVVQYVRNNPFWELRDDIQLLLTHAGAAIGGIAATPFYCDWDGNFLLEVGDKIALTAEDNSTITSYVLYDTIRYDGILAEATQFIHDGTEETASNPLSLGEKLKQTYAKVDKQNKEIQLVASESAANKESIASLTLTVDGIKLAIENLEDASLGDFTNLTERIAALELSNSEIKASVQETTQTVEAIEGDIDDLTAELGTTEATLGALQGTVSTHTTKIGELTTTTNSINASVSTLNSKTTVLETDFQAIDRAVGENTDSINTLGDNVMANNASINSLGENVMSNSEKITINTENIAALQIKDDSITASVSSLEKTTKTQIGGLEENYTNITEQMSELKLTDSALTLEITNIKNDGVSKVSGVGFSFDMSGLTIDKEDSELSTNINEDGLSVYRSQEEVLTADNKGVKAYNLHATTYLTIGDRGDGEGRSKFADYGTNRTGCFWTGN